MPEHVWFSRSLCELVGWFGVSLRLDCFGFELHFYDKWICFVMNSIEYCCGGMSHLLRNFNLKITYSHKHTKHHSQRMHFHSILFGLYWNQSLYILRVFFFISLNTQQLSFRSYVKYDKKRRILCLALLLVEPRFSSLFRLNRTTCCVHLRYTLTKLNGGLVHVNCVLCQNMYVGCCSSRNDSCVVVAQPSLTFDNTCMCALCVIHLNIHRELSFYQISWRFMYACMLGIFSIYVSPFISFISFIPLFLFVFNAYSHFQSTTFDL